MLWKWKTGRRVRRYELWDRIISFSFHKGWSSLSYAKGGKKGSTEVPFIIIFRELKQLLLQILLGNLPPQKNKKKLSFIYLVPTRSNSHLKVFHTGN